jgi:predicted amidohydrolase YtcJ
VAGDEVIFRNGAVFGGRVFLPAGTCVRVADGTITAVGPASEVAGPGGLSGVTVVDLDGGTLLPGFTDAHVHPVFAGDQLRRCDLRGGGTAQDYLDIIAAYAAAHPDAEWITGGGWAMDAFPGGLPRREPLDAVTGNRPAFFPNRDGHGAWVNTAALRLAGIDAATPDPADGRIGISAAAQHQ